MPNGSCDVKPTDQLSDKTGDDQCAVALHHRFLGTFIIMWQLDFSMWIFNHRNFFSYIAHRTIDGIASDDSPSVRHFPFEIIRFEKVKKKII